MVPAQSNRPAVLLVDDERDFLDATSALAEEMGYETVIAQSGPEALAKLEQRAKGTGSAPIEVILSDLSMPGMNGLAFLRAVRAGDHSALPFILVSGQLSLADLDSYVESDVDGVLIKPFVGDALLQAIQNAIYRRTLKETRRTLKEAA